jgi:hypothetical protein
VKIASYVWQLTRDYPGADPDDAHLPISEVWVKTHDGVSWMSHFDDHPAAPGSTAGLADLVRHYADRAIGCVPWCVPTGEDIRREAELAHEVLVGLERAAAAPRLAFDVEVEDSPNFWKGTPDELAALVGRVRQASPRAELWLVLYQDTAIGLERVAPLFDGYVTMDYWNNYRTQPEAQLDQSRRRLAAFGKPIAYGLPGDAPSAEFARGLSWVARQPDGRAVVWRRGITLAENWALIAQR